MVMVDLDDLVSRVDVCTKLGCSKTALDNWATRYPDFPPELKRFGARTAVYSWDAVRAWFIESRGIRSYADTPVGQAEKENA